jgi:hypothetical protein
VEVHPVAAPHVRNAQRRKSTVSRGRAANGVLLWPRHVAGTRELQQLAHLIGERAANIGVSRALTQMAFATLVDNGLEHGNGTVPVVAVHLSDAFLTVSSRDGGQAIAGSPEPNHELRRRIQIPAEDRAPGPGAPAGIPWLARKLEAESPESSLLFIAGGGSLTFRQGVWSCCRVEAIQGFIAVARIAR